ncbi:MAG: LacI family DNA-binding transcriptional regulator [Anaerolineae bacterium]|nr:LacI family DNA-binding transcriptional regulator [Anaerolineae bacterium]
MRPSIGDVAERASVSKTTVSHVINNTRFVSEETKQRVMEAISELGYRPSIAARSLTTNRTGTIGILISDAANQFFGDLLRGVEDVLGPGSYSLIVCNTDEILEREAHYLDLLLRQRVEGIIAAAASQRWAVLTQAEAQHTPIVFVDRSFEGMEGPFIHVDNEGGAYLGTRHLIECGHRRLGIVAGFQRLSTMRERSAGFRRALQENNLSLPEEWIVTCPLGIEAGREATRQILSLPEHPTALFLNNNLLSLGALLAIRDLGLRCPQDISLVGFDDHPWAAVSDPPLTVVRQPNRRLGQVAAEILLNVMNGKGSANALAPLPCELIIRKSCCSPNGSPRAQYSLDGPSSQWPDGPKVDP